MLTRRSWFQLTGGGALGSALALLKTGRTAAAQPPVLPTRMDHSAHAMGPVGRVSTELFDPMRYLRAWNFSDLSPPERARYYRETPRPDGGLSREYDFFAVDREIEIAPGVFFPAWTYNGQVPGPTIRATEGDRIRVNFVNQGAHPHTIHFHGWHPPEMDGSLPQHQVMPGDRFVYEFDAEPAGLHLYHCHAVPLKRHLHKGLYGAFIVDPGGIVDPSGRDSRPGRPPADELVMVMNAFDTNFDLDNEVYAVNTVASHYMQDPIKVKVGELVRLYVINVTEFDLVNSLHLHGMFFDVYRTGTGTTPHEHTDTVMLCQGERAILETRFRYPGDFMFHAHQSEFAELGWMGLFRAEGGRSES